MDSRAIEAMKRVRWDSGRVRWVPRPRSICWIAKAPKAAITTGTAMAASKPIGRGSGCSSGPALQ